MAERQEELQPDRHMQTTINENTSEYNVSKHVQVDDLPLDAVKSIATVKFSWVLLQIKWESKSKIKK